MWGPFGGVAVDLVSACVDVATGDLVGAGITVAAIPLNFVTFGIGGPATDAAKEVGKDAAIEVTKETAEESAKELTKAIGQDLGYTIFTYIFCYISLHYLFMK